MGKVNNLVNWFAESQTAPEDKRRHSGCLTIWLAIVVLGCLLFFTVTFTGFTPPKGFFLHYMPPSITFKVYGFDLLNIVLDLLIPIAAIGIWRWQKWGYYLLLAIYVLYFVLDTIVQFPHIINQYSYNASSLVGLGFLYALVHNELKYLRQREKPLGTGESANQTE